MKMKKILSVMLVAMLAVTGCSSQKTEKKEETKKEEVVKEISLDDARLNIQNLTEKVKSTNVEGKMEAKMTANQSEVLILNTINGKYLNKDGKNVFLATIEKKTDAKLNGTAAKQMSEKYEIFVDGDKPVMKKMDGAEFKEISNEEATEDKTFVLPTMLKPEFSSQMSILVGALGENVKLDQDENTYTLSKEFSDTELKKLKDKAKENNNQNMDLLNMMKSSKFKIVMDKKTNLPKEQVITIEMSPELLGEGSTALMTFTSKYVGVNDISELKIK